MSTSSTPLGGINFKASSAEFSVIEKIAARVSVLAAEHGSEYDQFTAEMDLVACHLNGCPLDLERLLSAPLTDFAHDVFGIRRHIDRRTGKLLDCFLPRYAQPAREIAA